MRHNAVVGEVQRALIVDDDLHVRLVISRWLSEEGYECLLADSAQAAIDYLNRCAVQLLTLDIAMPGRSGTELLEEIFAIRPDVVVLMVTATQEPRTAIDVLRRGASGYLIKPVTREQLILQARKTIAQRQMLIERRQHTERLEQQIEQQTVAIRHAHEETIHRLVAASSCRDVETNMHIFRTGLLAELLARAKGWNSIDAETIRLAAPMHDIGKIGIPDAILRKPSKLTREEFEIMKTHTSIGANMLEGSEVPMLQMARQIALCHHERWNGGGYPAGLASHAIPEAARIMAIIDAYDSLTHVRVYRPALPEKETLKIMRHGEGNDFDPALLAIFFQILPAIRRIAACYPDEPRNASDRGLARLPGPWPRWANRPWCRVEPDFVVIAGTALMGCLDENRGPMPALLL
jgi:putative two-component system response regulator